MSVVLPEDLPVLRYAKKSATAMTARMITTSARTPRLFMSQRPNALGMTPLAPRYRSRIPMAPITTALTKAQTNSLAIRSSLLAGEDAGAPHRAVERISHRTADERRHQPLPEEEKDVEVGRQVQDDDVEPDQLHDAGREVGHADDRQEDPDVDVAVRAQPGPERERLYEKAGHVQEEEGPRQRMGRAQDGDDRVEVGDYESAGAAEINGSRRPPDLGKRVTKRHAQTTRPDLVDALGDLHVGGERNRQQQRAYKRPGVASEKRPSGEPLLNCEGAGPDAARSYLHATP